MKIIPFHSPLDPKLFYRGPAHEEALARLQFLVEQRYRLGVVLGGRGSGKSLLLEVFSRQMEQSGQVVARVNLFGVERIEFLAKLATELGLNPHRSLDLPALWRLLSDRIRAHRYQHLCTVFLFDDADRASHEVLVQVARLVRHDDSPQGRMTIVLSGRAERVARLGSELLDLAELRIDLEPWELKDLEAYLRSALTHAGREGSLFAEPAVARLHELTQGIPRRVNQLAELALLAAEGRGLAQIDAAMLDSVCRELGTIEVSNGGEKQLKPRGQFPCAA